jgi:8-oxo-dGTP pyrophosphatase MutT (NUDIX family)
MNIVAGGATKDGWAVPGQINPLSAWQVVKKTALHEAAPWVSLSREHVRLPNGVEIPDFYRVDINPYVMMFALREDGRVAFIEHYKHGPQAVSLELPAGYIEEDDPLEAAKRELREETGLVAEHWHGFGKHFIDGNRGCGWVYPFLAWGAQALSAPSPDSTELMRLHFLTLDEVYALWAANRILNVASVSLIGQALNHLGYLKRGI